MRLPIVRRGGVVALLAVSALLAGTAPASAAPGDGSAFALQVSVTLLGGSPINVGPLAASNTAGPTTATVASATVPGVVTTGVLTSSSTEDPNTGAVTSTASTANVGLPLLAALGAVSANAIVATCNATQSGETGTVTLTNATLGSLGALAANPAKNTVIQINIAGINVATLTLNEQISNADGSLTVNAFHLHLLGGAVGALGTGDVIISSATCGPAALPIPMASGLGLWIGLGLLGTIAVPVGTRLVRRHRAGSTTAI